jgi:hypothetical protein
VHAVLDDRDIKIDEQPHPQMGQAELSENLTVMNRLQLFYGLQFHNNLSADQ